MSSAGETVPWMRVVSARRQSLFPVYGWSTGMRDYMDELVGDHIGNVLLVGRGNLYDGYYSRAELARVGERVQALIRDDPSFVKRHLADFYDRFDSLVHTAQEVSRPNLSALEDEAIGALYRDYYEAFRRLSPFMNIPHTVESFANERIKDSLRTELSRRDRLDELDDYFRKLAIPSDETYETEQRKEILAIAQSISDDQSLKTLFTKTLIAEEPQKVLEGLAAQSPGLLRRLEAHADRWAWVGMQSYLYSAYDVAMALAFLYEALRRPETPGEQLAKIDRGRERGWAEMEHVLNELSPDAETRGIIELLQQYVFLRTKRMEAFRKAYYYTRGLMAEVAKRMGSDLDSFFVISPEEVIRFFAHEKMPPENEVRKRLEARAFVMKEGKITLVGGWQAVDEVQLREVGLPEKPRRFLEGTSIFPGIVEGKVCVIRSGEELDKFAEGNILVTTMTMPDFAPAIAKASAIVTDEGGVTSHAALISREMQIPCVIGTQQATQVLSDGDLIRVDATSGVVERLEV